MAQQIMLKKDNLIKKSYVGFSWTVFFFGFFVPLFRGDWKWLLIMLILTLLSFGIASIILAFVYNKFYTCNLLEKGWRPVDEYSRTVLQYKGYLSE